MWVTCECQHSSAASPTFSCKNFSHSVQNTSNLDCFPECSSRRSTVITNILTLSSISACSKVGHAQSTMPTLEKNARDQLLLHQFLTGISDSVSSKIRATGDIITLEKAVEKARLLMITRNCWQGRHLGWTTGVHRTSIGIDVFAYPCGSILYVHPILQSYVG